MSRKVRSWVLYSSRAKFLSFPDHLQDSAPCYQYADETTAYKHRSVKGISQSVSDLNWSLKTLNARSTASNLTLNSEETKSMPIWTSHWPVSTTSNILIQVYKSLSTNLKESTTRNYWVFIYMNTKWDRHVNEVFNAYQEPILIGSCACYGILWTLPKLKNFTDSRLSKRLVGSLVLSKLDYYDSA